MKNSQKTAFVSHSTLPRNFGSLRAALTNASARVYYATIQK